MSSEALCVHAVEALLAEAEEVRYKKMKYEVDLLLNSLFDSSEEALLDAVVTSTPLRCSRAVCLSTLHSDGYIYETDCETMERTYNEEDDYDYHSH